MKLIVTLSIICAAGWLVWRILIFLRAFLRPVANPIIKASKPYVDSFNSHTEASLRSAGLGKIADFDKKINTTRSKVLSSVNKMMDEHEMKQK
jgi:hypothetical protein